MAVDVARPDESAGTEPDDRVRAGWRIDGVLLACLAAGAVLRCWGLGHDLPNVYNPDESSILLRALSLGAKTLNPHNFVYPSLFFYVLAVAVGCQFLALRALGRVASLKAFETAFLVDQTQVYLLARSVSVITGVVTVFGVYALARKTGSRAVARCAAALMAVAYIPVRDAHFVKHDVPVTLLVVLVVLASWRVWRVGRVRDSVVAGALAGAACAFHYYAAFAVIPVAAAHLLRVGSLGKLFADRRPWVAAGVCILAFVCLSPYVLLDHAVALRDIAANRQIVVGRGLATYGWFGAGGQHLQVMAGQGAGIAMLVAAAVGLVALARTGALAIWVLSFPVAFFLFLMNAWPFGRLQNPVYPFLAVMAACGVDWLARSWRLGRAGAAVLTVACMAQPLLYSIAIDRFFSADDTRTIARRWIEQHVPTGSAIALPTGSVQLVQDRQMLERALVRNAGSVGRASRRFQSMLALDPYPAPAYALVYLGRGGLDQDKIFQDPDVLVRDQDLGQLRQAGVRYVVLKQFSPLESDPLRPLLAAQGRLVFRISPFNDRAGADSAAQLPDYDVRPSLDVDRAGPIVEVWELR